MAYVVPLIATACRAWKSGPMTELFDTGPQDLIATRAKCAPASAGQFETGNAAPGWLEWRGKGCILVVDDEDAVRTVVTHAVRRFGFTVKSASSGPQAISLFESDPGLYSLVLLDLRLPGMGGDEIVRHLRLVRPNIPVILMSGYGTQEALDRVTRQGISGLLSKPFTLEALALKMRAVLDP